MNRHVAERYLRVLGIPRREPGTGALFELVRAHMLRIPFENLSKLYYLKRFGLRDVPDLDLYLDGIERFHFGGTCYSSNFYLCQLLAHLGYEARLCGADMSKPDVHMATIVSIEKREYLVDVGYAAPFLSPLPRDLAFDHTVELGRDRYVLRPQDERGQSRVELFRDGNLKHGYVVKPNARSIQEFGHIVADSYRDEATFMNALLLARFYPNRSVVIHNLALIESHDGSSSIRALGGRDELVQSVYDCFAIPREVTREVLDDLGQLGGDAWS